MLNRNRIVTVAIVLLIAGNLSASLSVSCYVSYFYYHFGLKLLLINEDWEVLR